MSERRWGELTWKGAEAAIAAEGVALLPLGAVEAHGPHLPLITDGLIAEAMARAATRELHPETRAFILPTLDYAAAPFAADFAGTISVQPETITLLVFDIGAALAASGVRLLALANAHLDPAHLLSLHEAARRLEAETALRVAFPDLTRKPWASRLTEEFKTGACHAGRYESSVVMAERPDLVDDTVRRALPPNEASLATAIREGKGTFEEAGGPQAYFGWPADASESEGEATVDVLGEILADAVRQRMAELDGGILSSP